MSIITYLDGIGSVDGTYIGINLFVRVYTYLSIE